MKKAQYWNQRDAKWLSFSHLHTLKCPMNIHLPLKPHMSPKVLTPSFERQSLWSKWSIWHLSFAYLYTLLGIYHLTGQVNFELFKRKDGFIPFWLHHVNSSYIPSQRCWIHYLLFLSCLHNSYFMITIFRCDLSITRSLTHIPC